MISSKIIEDAFTSTWTEYQEDACVVALGLHYKIKHI